MNNKYFGFNDDDLIFLFGKNKNKAMKSLEALFKTHPEYTDYEALDHLSKGHGREAYVKLSNHRIKSVEYMNAFEIFLQLMVKLDILIEIKINMEKLLKI